MSDRISIDLLNQEIYLDRECRRCEGRGKLTLEVTENMKRSYIEKACSLCNGRGYSLTIEGEAIINLVKRYL